MREAETGIYSASITSTVRAIEKSSCNLEFLSTAPDLRKDMDATTKVLMDTGLDLAVSTVFNTLTLSVLRYRSDFQASKLSVLWMIKDGTVSSYMMPRNAHSGNCVSMYD